MRLVCATHQDLEQAMSEGRFRRDLYYRLCVVPLVLPPLRQRRQDIPVLMRHFLREIAPHQGLSFSAEVDALMMAYRWPGNVRELRNIIERMVLLREGDRLGADDLPAEIRAAPSASSNDSNQLPFELPEGGLDLRDLERRVIVAALARVSGNQSAAARFLSIPRHVLTYRIEKFDIAPSEYGSDDPLHREGK